VAVPAAAGAVDRTNLDMWARGVPYDEFARLRREAPVAWHDEASPNSGFWSVHCYQDILTASRDVATFSSARGISFEEPTDEDMAARRTIIDTDPPEHTKLRKIVTGRCPCPCPAPSRPLPRPRPAPAPAPVCS
jgi:cytochrome P450